MNKDGTNKNKRDGVYRIGEYSRFMGVSTDLLKHYERCGLIEPQTSENGYRYYRFPQSTRLLECMRLRNYGLSLKDMQTTLDALPYDDVQKALDSRIDALEEYLRFQQRMIAEHRRLSRWMDMMRGRTQHLTHNPMESMLFLPQSRSYRFLEDDRITCLLESWVSMMPLVVSCRLFGDILADDAIEKAMWGLAIREEDAEAIGLPVNDAVIRIPGGESLQLHMRQSHQRNAAYPHYFRALQTQLRDLGVKSGTPALQINLMTLECTGESHKSCGLFCIPAAHP